jgi:hypothetical protein
MNSPSRTTTRLIAAGLTALIVLGCGGCLGLAPRRGYGRHAYWDVSPILFIIAGAAGLAMLIVTIRNPGFNDWLQRLFAQINQLLPGTRRDDRND